MKYRTIRELQETYRYRKRTAVDRRVEFIENHPERYPVNSVKRNASGRILVDLDAFDDAYRYGKLIVKGLAPAFK